MSTPLVVALPLLSPRGAALRRIGELRTQRHRFASLALAAEAATRPRTGGTSAESRVAASAEDRRHLATQGLRNAERILRACEAAYAEVYGEWPPDDIDACAEAVEPRAGLVEPIEGDALDLLRRRRERERAYWAAYRTRRKAAAAEKAAPGTLARQGLDGLSTRRCHDD